MDVNNQLIDDIPTYEMKDNDDGTQVYDSGPEDGSDKSSSDSDTDSEQEIQNTVAKKSIRKRGLTRLPKLLKFVMSRLGMLLRNFRRKLYAKYIEPNIRNLVKLARIPKRYRSILRNQDDWNNFVTYTQSENFKDVSKKTIIARSKSVYDHRTGRGGYTSLREKLVKNKVLAKDEMPPRSLMLYKGRENKAGDIVDPNAKLMADKLMEQEKQIKDGELKLDSGENAMTLVFGKENGGFLKGVGTGVTSTRYFHVPQSKGSSKEEIMDLKFALQNERRELQKKDEELKALSTKLTEQDKTLHLVLAHPASQGMKLQNLESSTDSQQKTKDTTSPQVLKSIKCSLSYPQPRNIVALGTVYLSSERQTIHGVPLQDDCYKVSIDEVNKGAAFLPHETGEYKTVEQAHGSFVAWPKFLVKCDSKVPHMKSTQDSELQNSKKRKNLYCTKEDIVKNTRSIN